jgi:hypothetical protein
VAEEPALRRQDIVKRNTIAHRSPSGPESARQKEGAAEVNIERRAKSADRICASYIAAVPLSVFLCVEETKHRVNLNIVSLQYQQLAPSIIAVTQ